MKNYMTASDDAKNIWQNPTFIADEFNKLKTEGNFLSLIKVPYKIPTVKILNG